MTAAWVSRIFAKQEWQLAAGIVILYLPIRIFVSNNVLTTEILMGKAPLWTVEFLVNLAFFRIWIVVIELIQWSFNWLDASFRLKFPRLLFTYVIGLILAILFNIAFIFLWQNMAILLQKQLHISIRGSGPERNIYNMRQKTKANTGLTVMAMLATVYMVSVRRSNEQLKEVQLRAERLEKENLQSQFSALKSQLSPHFLFNSFSILTSLIEKNPEKSVLYVNRLSKSYRYILDHANQESVTLRTELDFVDAYVFLLKSRFEEKLHVDVEIAQNLRNQCKIAPLTLQLLIENAVKHNQMSTENPFQITIHNEGEYLVVSNPMRKRKGVGPSPEIGLPNIVRRYALLTTVPVLISETDHTFTVKIPLLT